MKGHTGAQCIQGLKGDIGAEGIQGLKGETGQSGSTASVSSWVLPSQSNVTLSYFGRNLSHSRLSNLPATISWSTLSGRPTWITSPQSLVSLLLLSSNLDAKHIPNLPQYHIWLSIEHESISLSNYGGNLDVSRIDKCRLRPRLGWLIRKATSIYTILADQSITTRK